MKYAFFLLSRSLVFKKGQLLEVSHNFLKDASTIDASEYTSMNIFCNYAEKEQTEECLAIVPKGEVFLKKSSNHSALLSL